MTTFTTLTTIPFQPLLLFQKSKISPPFFIHLYLFMRPHGRPMSMVLADYHIISYHIIYPTASTDRSSDYMNESKRVSFHYFFSFHFFHWAVGLTSLFLFITRTGIA